MIAPYYLILTMFYSDTGITIDHVPMQTMSACQQAGLSYTTKMKDGKTPWSKRISFVCVKSE